MCASRPLQPAAAFLLSAVHVSCTLTHAYSLTLQSSYLGPLLVPGSQEFCSCCGTREEHVTPRTTRAPLSILLTPKPTQGAHAPSTTTLLHNTMALINKCQGLPRSGQSPNAWTQVYHHFFFSTAFICFTKLPFT